MRLAFLAVLLACGAAAAADEPEAVYAKMHAAALAHDLEAVLYYAAEAERATMPVPEVPKSYRLTGKARDIYSNTGRESNVRKMTVWVDTDSMLIRKVVEEWPPLPGQVSRYTTIYDPQANPAIDAAKFKFEPPTR